MEISFPINKLLRAGLTPDEYSICMLLNSNKLGLLREFVKLKGETFYDNIKNLNILGYVDYNTIGNIVDIKDITLTNKLQKLLSFGDPFMELYEKFPVKVKRPDGKTDLLRVNKSKCRLKYTKLIKSDPMLHEHILECLDHEIKHRKERSSTGYFRRMYNWIETREWEKYEESLHGITNKKIPQQKTEGVVYGTKIL